MIILKTKVCARQLRKTGLTDNDLTKAISEFLEGLHDGNLGSNLYKKRVPRYGKGKSSGARTILFYKKEKRLIFVHVFAKNDKENITREEHELLKRLANTFDAYTNKQIEMITNNGALIKIKYGDSI